MQSQGNASIGNLGTGCLRNIFILYVDKVTYRRYDHSKNPGVGRKKRGKLDRNYVHNGLYTQEITTA